MVSRKALFFIGLLAIFSILLPASPVWSGLEGGPPAPTNWDNVVGPELWGVVVIHCGAPNNVGTIRVKRIQDCNVETQALVDFSVVTTCFDDESNYLYYRFPKPTFFDGQEGIPAGAGEWIITKIKNFEHQAVGLSTIVSFDAQIKFELD